MPIGLRDETSLEVRKTRRCCARWAATFLAQCNPNITPIRGDIDPMGRDRFETRAEREAPSARDRPSTYSPTTTLVCLTIGTDPGGQVPALATLGRPEPIAVSKAAEELPGRYSPKCLESRRAGFESGS